MFWKKAGLVSIVLAALAIVAYAQTTTKQRAHSATLQAPSGYLGVGVQDKSGVVVTRVNAGEPGDKAGVRVNDVILEINGQKVDNGEEFTNLIISKAPGARVNLLVLRGGVKHTMAATLGLRPPDLPLTGPAPQGLMIPAMPFGMTPEDLRAMMTGDVPRGLFAGEGLGPQLAAYFGVHEGVLVLAVDEKTPAERAGLKAGDVVTKVNGMPVASPREISGVVRQTNKKAVVFTVIRDKKEITLTIEIAWNRDPNDRDAIN